MNNNLPPFDLSHTAAVILAAGKGTRMNSVNTNKVALKIGDKPMISRTVSHLQDAGVSQIIAVIGFQAESVKTVLGQSVEYATQRDQLGTGDAVKSALPVLRQDVATVLTVYGDDSAFYPPSLYQEMVAKQQALDCDLLLLTIHKEDPTGLGRILRDSSGTIQKIVEEKVATAEQKKIQEINTGFYCFKRHFLETYLSEITKNPISGEYYLTDLVEIALKHHKKVEAHYVADSSIWHGVNRPEDLEAAQIKLINHL